jgi:hypothetical protein
MTAIDVVLTTAVVVLTVIMGMVQWALGKIADRLERLEEIARKQ